MNHYRGGQGILYIYTYCMYTIKLKALILSIVFNYLRFLMMKIDCTVFVFLFFACACCCQNWRKLYGWYTPTLMSHSCSARCKKKKRHFCSHLLPIMNAQIKHL